LLVSVVVIEGEKRRLRMSEKDSERQNSPIEIKKNVRTD